MENEESLSQGEIDALLSDIGGFGDMDVEKPILSNEDKLSLLEIINQTLTEAAPVLSAALNKEVILGNPQVSEFKSIQGMAEPFSGEGKIFALIEYSQGIKTLSPLILKSSEAKQIALLMSGGQGDSSSGDLSEMEMSTVTEGLNQMISAMGNCLTNIHSKPIEMVSSQIVPYDSDIMLQMLPNLYSEPLISLQFPFEFTDGDGTLSFIQLVALPDVYQILNKQNSPTEKELQGVGASKSSGNQTFDAMAGETHLQSNPVTVQPVQFAPLDNQPPIFGNQNKNLELVMDVTLSLTVELGKTEISIKEVLELTRGSVIELDRVAGEPVDLLANGKLIAKGEVVVIEDNFGLRITSIVSPAERLRGL